MIAFEVKDMTCGHCVGAITKALKIADQDAKATIDLAQHLVVIEPAAAGEDELRAAIVKAGYQPVQVAAAASKLADRPSPCCGHCR